MPKFYDVLGEASLENLAADPSNLPEGRIWENTTSFIPKIVLNASIKQLVTNDASQTLTNKTMSGASNTFSNISLTSAITGVLPIANGGTNNGSLAVTAGGALYADGSKVMNTGAGTAGQFLKSAGAGAPVWASLQFAQEVPSGSINDSNVTFTLAQTPLVNAAVLVFLDGSLQKQTVDYTLSGSTITFAIAPATGQSIAAFYQY